MSNAFRLSWTKMAKLAKKVVFFVTPKHNPNDKCQTHCQTKDKKNMFFRSALARQKYIHP